MKRFINFIGRHGAGLFLLFTAVAAADAQTPQWIWPSTNNMATAREVHFFRKTFTVKQSLAEAVFTGSADDGADFYLNGKKLGTVHDWKSPLALDVTKDIVMGDNVIAVRAWNENANGGMVAQLEMTAGSRDSKKKGEAGMRSITKIVTDTKWFWSDVESPKWTNADFDDDTWKRAASIVKMGGDPWGQIFAARVATTAESIKVEKGFKVELLHSATTSEGSWISMTIDNKGRLIISPQEDGKLLRVTIANGRVADIERINSPLGSAMGLLYADNYLFLDGKWSNGWGIYRMRAHGEGFDKPEYIRPLSTGGEHGSHSIVMGPDHKLYIVCGNFTKVPEDILGGSPMQNYADDQLLPRAEDGRGFGAGLHPPGGYVIRMDLDGSNCELFDAGMRNTYDIAFDKSGELIGFDSDMEWDWGTAWYRPIRVIHLVAGADFGFREGSGKFPEYYQDTLPATLDVGIGSPTGILFGTKTKFPKSYREACFMEDWSYGRLFAVHFTPDGATFDATIETVLRGIPLNLTALEVGADGALYFITGGRNTESGLYRLTYVGSGKSEPSMSKADKVIAAQGKTARRLRHDLEAFYGRHDRRIVDAVWSSMGSDDRFIRYAARTALEFQDVNWWKDRAIAETNTETGLTALLALARCGGHETQRGLLLALKRFPMASLTPEQQLLKLRLIEVSFARQGAPDHDLAELAIEKLGPLYPAATLEMNRELCSILLYLNAPGAVEKTVSLLDKAPTLEEQTYYAMRLRTITNGWTQDLRRDYFSWFNKNHDSAGHPAEILQYFKDVDRDYSDGASMGPFLENFRNEAEATLSVNERLLLSDVLPKEKVPQPAVNNKKFVKEWHMSDLVSDLSKAKSGRSFKSGEAAFTDAQCILCHRFGNKGGSIGPELAAVSSRLSTRDILESILEPSKVVSEQYQNIVLETKDGDTIVGRLLDEDDTILIMMTDPMHPERVKIQKSDVVSRHPSKMSPMPEGLVNSFSEDEIWDLIAYLESGGKKSNAAFKQ